MPAAGKDRQKPGQEAYKPIKGDRNSKDTHLVLRGAHANAVQTLTRRADQAC